MKSLTSKVALLTCATSLLTFTLVLAQTFQGTLTYVQDFDLPKSFLDMGITKEMMNEKIRSSGDWFDTVRISYRDGNYHALTNSSKKSWKIYKADENKLYSFVTGDDGVICVVQKAVDLDMTGAPDKPVTTQLDTTVTILGHPCKVVRMKWQLGAMDYYYNPSVNTVRPELFAQHSSEGFAEFLKISRSLPLRVVRNAMGLTIVQTLTAAKAGEVKADLFAIPKLEPDKQLNVMNMPGTEIFRVKK